MGCWGIKALESDEGLDIIIELEKILDTKLRVIHCHM